MGKKYFAGYCVMNREDLRANPFFHATLVLCETEDSEEDELKLPLHVVDSYSFQSHPIPYKASLFKEPFTYLCQLVGTSFRLRNSYGEWIREAIHDLAFGRGLTGVFISLTPEQFFQLNLNIADEFIKQNEYLPATDDLLQKEIQYANKLKQKKPPSSFKEDMITKMRLS